MSATLTFQETFESEYPLLDSSLLAAFISELPSEADPSHDSLETLRHTLTQLSLEAQDDPSTSDIPRTHDCSVLGSDELAGSQNSTNTGALGEVSPFASGASSTSTCATSTTPAEPALDFLHTLFPHLSRATLTQTLQEFHDLHNASDHSDLSTIVDHLLNLEYIQELAERGLDEEVDSGDWYMAHRRRGNSKRKTKSRPCKYTIPLVDIRQRRHALRVTNGGPSSSTSSISADPWTRFESLATWLSEVLKPVPRGFFMSYFHAPAVDARYSERKWKSEGDALREALSVLSKRMITMNISVGEAAVEAICDVVLDPEAHDVAELDVEQRKRLVADARLCATATRGDPSTAIDLVWILRELDDAFIRGEGVAHAAKNAVVESDGDRTTALACPTTRPGVQPPKLMPPIHPPPTPPPPLLPKYPRKLSNHANGGWTLVEPRRPAEKLPHSHAELIPAYTCHTRHTRQHFKSSESQYDKGAKSGAKSGAGELQVRSVAWYRACADEFQTQRTELLHEATRHWKGRNAKNRGGEVAVYYAEKARELQEQQRKLALDAARKMVEEKRSKSTDLDLHGLTVAEACIIVTETLARTPPSLERPLKIITGRGRHSVGRVGVLGPVVQEMLRSAGWRVSTRDGGLIVCGRV